MVVQRGFKKPSSYHVDRLRQMPIGYFYDVMTNGFGAMSDYAAQVPPAGPLGDRGLRPHAAVQPVRPGRRRAGRQARRARPEPGRGAGRGAPPMSLPPSVDAHVRGGDPGPSVLSRIERTGLAVGGVFLLALAAGFAIDRGQFFRSYLLGFLFWVGIAVGCLGLAMLNHLTGGLWGLVPRRFHEAAARTLPAMGLLFIPVVPGRLLGLHVGAARGRGRGRASPEESRVPQRAVLHRPRRLVLRGLGAPRLARELVVAPAGRRRRPCPRRAAARPLRRRSRPPLPHHHVRRGGLGDVARPALVLHHLRGSLHRGLDPVAPSRSPSS